MAEGSEWVTCCAESNRPVTVRLHAGEPTASAEDPAHMLFGEVIRDSVLLPACAVTPEDTRHEESQAEASGADPARQAVNAVVLNTDSGAAELRSLQLGELAASGPTLAAGLYTLVFATHDLPDAYACVSVVAAKGKK